MKISEQGIALIKSFESCKLTAYKAVSTEQYWSIGWGHYGADVEAGQTISQDEADTLFLSDLQQFVKYTNTYTAALNLNQDQFDALVSFCYNCGSGTLKKLVSGRTVEEIAEHITDSVYTKSDGKVLNGLVRRRQEEKELFCKGREVKLMAIKVGSARIDENGKLSNGKAGDQTGKEVSTQDYYLHSKGWYLMRPKSVEDADKLAASMLAACENDNIGYDQGNRLDIITQLKKYGSMAKIVTKTEADCGTLVRGCCIEAGFDPGNFNTANEAACLEKTGKFEKKVAVTSSTTICNGDVLVTKTKGHTVIVTSGNPRKANQAVQTSNTSVKQKIDPDKAKSFDKTIARKYRVKTELNLRLGAGKLKTPIAVMDKGDEVQCYGYYTLVEGKKWYLVQYGLMTGFCSSEYLEKVIT
ncbi:MAG: lysozyme [Lachnospiraceae bacterium]|nr:lysozyme [Lachnospiraceae bacterium]